MDFTPEQQNALSKYEDIKLQIKELEAELDPLKEVIMPIMEKGKDFATEKGVFKLKERANWKFSEYVTRQEKELKVSKEDEIAKGIAQNKPTIYLEYSVNKVEEDKGE